MARKPKNTVTFAPFVGHVNVPLLPEMVDSVTTWLANPYEINTAFLDLADEGFSISCKPKPEGGYVASVQVVDALSVNAGLAIYGNAPTGLEARAVLLVKLNFIGQDSDWTSKASGGNTTRYR